MEMVHHRAGGEAVTHSFLAARAALCGADEVVEQLVKVDERGKLIRVGEFEHEELAPPMRPIGFRAGDMGRELVGVTVVPAEVDEDPPVSVEVAAREVGPATRTHVDRERVMAPRP